MGPGAVRPRLALAALAAAAALACPVPAAAALPAEGVLVPGMRLGGVSLGMAKAEVRRTWGSRFGRCRDCATETWYFTYRQFEPQGAGVVFRRGRVVHAFTLWQPEGWRTARGLELGDREEAVTEAYPGLGRRACVGYTALLLPGARARTAFYLYRGELWGFGLMRPGRSPCL